MKLYLDLETSDRWIFGSRDQAVGDETQPHLVRLAWALEDQDGTPRRDACHLILLPTGESMDIRKAFNTGIFDWQLVSRGIGLGSVLSEFAEALGEADLIIAFNWEHKRKVLERSFRYVGWPARTWPPHCCVQIAAMPIIRVGKVGAPGNLLPSIERTRDYFIPQTRLMPTMDPVADGFKLLHAVRDIHAAIRQHQEGKTA